ncbi:hypothetical protein GYB22_08265 [bacterium]|nr:hypothetical protein [bacterium]
MDTVGFNISANPQYIDTGRTFPEISDILIEEGEFNSRGWPYNDRIDNGDAWFNPQNPDQIIVNHDYLKVLTIIIRNHDLKISKDGQ